MAPLTKCGAGIHWGQGPILFAPLNITSSPRKRESIGLTIGPRFPAFAEDKFRGGDDPDSHFFEWAVGHIHSERQA